MPVPLLDLSRQYDRIRDAVNAEIESVVASQSFILGPKVEELESGIVEITGANHAVGMSSGTDAWLAILMAEGWGPGDAIITTPYTFFATVGCVHRLGIETVFVDIDPVTFNLDPRQLEARLAEFSTSPEGELRTAKGNVVRAVVPVHLFGLCCEMDAILALASRHDLKVVEDAAQAIGAEYPSPDGTVQAGAIGEYAYFSFFPAKNLGAYGDAGLATCRAESDAARLRLVRNHGMEQRYYHPEVGGNFRLDALQAAVLNAKLPHVATWNAERRTNADRYAAAFAAAGLTDRLSLPRRPFEGKVGSDHIFHQYVLRAPHRDALSKHLGEHGIGHGIYYPVPLHRQQCFEYLGYPEGSLPTAEAAARETIALPIFSELREDEIAEIVETIARFYETSPSHG
ncbi:MAG: DegT/DnrJ/EryC1/StrS family aminotransferase [Chthoniobacterales bacterium]